MPMETDRLKLPLPLGNENVTRESINAIFEKIDAGVATQEDLETLREAVNKMDIPDASLTVKGKVQLSSKTNGTSETLAATEKAVKAAVDSAIPRMIPDTRNVPTKPSDYKTNVAYSFKTGSVAGLPAEQFVVIHGLKGWHDDSGGVTHEYASGGTTGRMYHRTGTSANDTWGPWMQIIDNGAAWQKRMLTNDDGASLNISNGDANTLTRHGFYVGENIANAPRTGAGEWWYIRVSAMNVNLWVKQEAINLFSNTYQMRTGSDAGNGTINWSPWTQDLFTSVSNGKASIAAAITDKNVPTAADAPFATMAANIGKIQQGNFQQLVISGSSAIDVAAGYKGPLHSIVTIPAKTRLLSVLSNAFFSSGSMRLAVFTPEGSQVQVGFGLWDQAGRVWRIGDGSNPSVTGQACAVIYGFLLDMQSGVGTVKSNRLPTLNYDTPVAVYSGYLGPRPENFDLNGPLNFGIISVENLSSARWTVYFTQGFNLMSM